MKKPKIVIIVGPTGSGKSSLSLDLAQKFKGEIISADSVQVYRGLDIGSAKPSIEQRRWVPHHLIDIRDPNEDFSAGIFARMAEEIIRNLVWQKTPIFIVGGTGLYVKALTNGLFQGPAGNIQLRSLLFEKGKHRGTEVLHQELLRVDPEAAYRIHSHDKIRLIRALEIYTLTHKPISLFHKEHQFQERPYHVLQIALQYEREELYKRIESRVEKMIAAGWVEEVRFLLHQGYGPECRSMQSLGYKHLVSFLSGHKSFEEAVRLVKRDTRRYAKRQMTWFKSNRNINWFPMSPDVIPHIEGTVEKFLNGDHAAQ